MDDVAEAVASVKRHLVSGLPKMRRSGGPMWATSRSRSSPSRRFRSPSRPWR